MTNGSVFANDEHETTIDKDTSLVLFVETSISKQQDSSFSPVHLTLLVGLPGDSPHPGAH